MSNALDDYDDQVDVEVEVEAELEVDDDFDGDDEAAAMAAAMGFSNFGMKESNRPSKKRRFNDGKADADAGTGANSMPLPPRTSAVQEMIQTTDEIDLGDDDDAEIGSGNQDQPPPPGAATQLPAAYGLPPKPPGATSYEIPLVPPPGLHGPSYQAGGRGGRGGRGPTSRGGRGGGHSVNREWYLDYYDPSFNENPWERLEQSKGLTPLGSWLPGRSAGGKSTATSS